MPDQPPETAPRPPAAPAPDSAPALHPGAVTRSPLRWVIGATLALGAVAIPMFAWTIRHSDELGADVVDPSGPAPAGGPSVGDAAAGEFSDLPIEIVSTPAGATVMLGSRRLGLTPLTVPASALGTLPAEVRLSLEGYVDATLRLENPADREHRVVMAPRPTPSTQPATQKNNASPP